MDMREINSDKDLAKAINSLLSVVEVDAVICLTETGKLAKEMSELDTRVVVATANSTTYEQFVNSDVDSIRIPIHGIDKYRQIPHLLSVALKSDSISVGDFVLVTIGRDVYPDGGNLIVLSEAERELEELSIKDLLKLTDGIRPAILDSAIELAKRIGLVARRKKRIGTIFTLGDSDEVLKCSEQLIPNPFQGHDESTRRIADPSIHDSVIELAKLDGAFVIRGDGLIKSAGTFLGPRSGEPERIEEEVELPEGLGTRHMAAAATTARTEATAIVVSATDGHIRVFAGGTMVLKIDPDIEYGLVDGDSNAH